MGRFGWVAAGILVLGVGILVALGFLQQAREQKPLDNPIAKAIEEKAEANKSKPDPVPDNYIEAGGVMRPKQDVLPPQGVNRPGAGEQAPIEEPGIIPGVDPDTNASTRSVAEAFVKPELAYRLTSMLPAPKFDPVAYAADPDTYLNTVEPGRIWQAAEPGEGVTPIKRTSRYRVELLQGEKVNLEAQVAKGNPVVFYSPRLGQFDNQLSVITVRADEDGIARTSFRASSGTRGEIDILASSPLHSGTARYLVKVILPVQAP